MLQSIGFGVLVVFIPLGFLGMLVLLQFLWSTPAPWGALLLAAGLASLHYQRGDRFFLEQLTTRPIGIYGIEYLLTASFFLGFFAYWGQWWNVLIGLISILVLAMLPAPYAAQKTTAIWSTIAPVAWIPIFLWEWKAGFRQQGWWMFLLYGLSLFAGSYTAVIPVVVLLLALTVCHFYQAVAPKEIIQASNKTGNLLARKMRQSCLFFQGLLLPHYALFLLYQSSGQALLGILFLIIISSCWISFSICLQYSSYTYDTKYSYNVVPFAIFIGAGLVPFTWPLLPFFWLRYWRKAQQQLTYYA